ncbi:MAG: hypothetical protein HDS71_06215 [Bacteroidales bacterium]|nr:hypothetical protein [Bacteroidales bacterium]
MTENQKKLMPYVEARVAMIVSEKESHYISPVIATETEIISDIRSDVIECMRELHRTEKYHATNTLNLPALKKIEQYGI